MRLKIIYVLLFVCPFTYNTQAQNKVRFGIKAGFNTAHFNTSIALPSQFSVRDDPFFYAGGEVEVKIGKHFSLQPELFYVEYSAMEGVSASERLKQICIPVLAKIHVGKIAFYGGPQIDLLLKAEQEYFNAAQQRRLKINTTDSSFTKAGLSVVGGIEWTFRYKFGLDLRYVFGMSNRCAKDGITFLTGFEEGQKIKINCLQAGLYYRFGKKPKA